MSFICSYRSMSVKNKFLFWFCLLLSGFTWLGFSCFTSNFDPIVSDYTNFAKAMLDGKVIYRDIIDHKGLYNFLPYLFISFFDRKSMVLYTIMTYAGGILFYITCLCYMNTFSDNYRRNIIISGLTSVLISCILSVCSPAPFYSPDTFMLCVVLFLFHYIQTGAYKRVDYRVWFVLGLFVGLNLWTKYSLLAIYGPFYCYIISRLWSQDRQKLFKAHIFGVCGVVTVTIPVMIYCGVYSLYADMFHNYFQLISVRDVMLPFVFFSLLVLFLYGLVYICVCKDEEKTFLVICSLVYLGNVLASSALYVPYSTFICCALIPVVASARLSKCHAIISKCILIAVCALFVGANIEAFVAYDKDMYHNADIAKQYDITNDDIIYLCTEDLGFGDYSEGGTYRYQWMPGKVRYSSIGRQIFDYQLRKIRNHEVDFVAYDIRNLEMFADVDVSAELVSNKYKMVEKLLIPGTTTGDRVYMYLWESTI